MCMFRTKLTIHHDLHRVKKIEYNKMLANAKKHHYNTKIVESGHDSKAIAKVIDDILHRNKETKLPKHTSSLELANRFVTYFSDKINGIRESLPKLSCTNDARQLPTPACSLSTFECATEEEVSKLISASSPKSCTLDPIPSWVVKSAKEELVPLITRIINASLTNGKVPDCMKLALITPLLKKSNLDPDILKNYRPVSNLSFLSKTLERIVAMRITKYMTVNNLHDHFQSAYKAYHSTETALLKVQNDVLRTLDKQGVTVLVLLDLSAAFDTIDHSVLLSRIQSLLGISGSVLEWFRSYLMARKQAVKINGTTSATQNLDCGVPQGSVLGPLLFLAYILPLGHLIRTYGLEMHGYADDTQIYLSLPRPSDQTSVQNSIAKLEQCLSDIHTWMCENKLKLNAAKTEIILFGSNKDLANINISSLSVAGTKVLVSQKPIRNLGAIFDSRLDMAAQVRNMVKTTCFHLRNIGRVRNMLTVDTAKQVVQSLVISRLDYCNALLAGIPNNLMERLQRIQNSAARLVSRTRRQDHITPVLINLHWLPIKCRIDFKILLLVYKTFHGEAPVYICKLLTPYQPKRTLRSGDKGLLDQPRAYRRTFGDRAFAIYAPNAWNALPQNIRLSPSVASFKKNLKTHLFHLCYK